MEQKVVRRSSDGLEISCGIIHGGGVVLPDVGAVLLVLGLCPLDGADGLEGIRGGGPWVLDIVQVRVTDCPGRGFRGPDGGVDQGESVGQVSRGVVIETFLDILLFHPTKETPGGR